MSLGNTKPPTREAEDSSEQDGVGPSNSSAEPDLTAAKERMDQLSLHRVRGVYSHWAVDSEAAARESRPRTDQAASVAMILRQRQVLEVLLIERAARGGDPWSGQVAMPGGRCDPEDEDSVATAVRETVEEVGIQLAPDQWLASLGSMQGARRVSAMSISAELFAVEPSVEIGTIEAAEVEKAMWVPVRCLTDPLNAVHYLFADYSSPFPGVLLPDGRNVLWGLTYRFLARFLEPLRCDIAAPTASSELVAQSAPAPPG